jgi:RNA polymerase sigma factor (sigma-70 family)
MSIKENSEEQSIGGAALEKLFKDSYASLRNYAQQLLDDPHAAEEIVQEAFFKLANNPAAWNNVTHCRAYCAKVIYHLCMDRCRGRKNVYAPMEETAHEQIIDDSYDPVLQLLRVELYEAVGKAMEELPQPRREVIWLTWLEEKPLEEVAILMGKSYEATKALKQRAGQQLREILIKKYHFRPELLQVLLLFL